jgi:hypothetical protein
MKSRIAKGVLWPKANSSYTSVTSINWVARPCACRRAWSGLALAISDGCARIRRSAPFCRARKREGRLAMMAAGERTRAEVKA